MDIKIDKGNGIPIYIQIRDGLRKLIAGGSLVGNRLPTERRLSEELDVSRNTVSMAYKELADEGVISSQIGRGTFASGALLKRDRPGLAESVERSAEEALDAGYSLDEYRHSVEDFVRKKKEALKKTRIIFIDGEKSRLPANCLNPGPGAAIESLSLEELKKNPGKLNNADLVVASVTQLKAAEKLLNGRKARG
jgi:GntR family transcriptional regulator